MSRKSLSKEEAKKRELSGQKINHLNSSYLKKVVQATKNIESTVFGRVHELGQRARMAQALSHLLDQMEAGNFRVGTDTKKGSIFLVVDLEEQFRESIKRRSNI